MSTPANANADSVPGIGASLAAPAHDKGMAVQFLAALDPTTDRFTFQFFGDGPGRYAEIFHGTLEQVWPKVLALNTPTRRVGAFVTINETDLQGRREENILRPRALFVDADTPEQIASCLQGIGAAGAPPSIVVGSGRGEHFYWPCSDIPRDEFSSLQKCLIEKLGTDKAIHDLPRVMRLPGTLHLKDEAQPRLVKLTALTSPPRRWVFSELATKFGASPVHSAPASEPNNVVAFKLPDWALKGRPHPAFAHLPLESLAEGLRPDLEKIRSAAAAIPSSAIEAEPDWTKLARALAHEAAVHRGYTEQLWGILDALSRTAPGYDQQSNRERFFRYGREAFNRSKPITIGTLFCIAADHGWDGEVSSTGASEGANSSSDASKGATANSNSSPANGAISKFRAVPISALPLIPPKREWLQGTDLMLGVASMMFAQGGRAKTTWMLTSALSCASGRPLLGVYVYGGQHRVLYLSAEDSTDELARRIRAAMNYHKLKDSDVSGLHIIGAAQWGLPLLRNERGAPALHQEGWNALIAELDAIQPDVLYLDPVINFMGGVSANDNSAAGLLMGELTKIAAKRRIAVMLAHHAAKGRDPTSVESAMGAASFGNLSRIVLSIEPLAEADAGRIGLPPWEAKSVFRVLGTKQNFSPPDASDRWFRLHSVELQNQHPPVYPTGDRVAVVEVFQPGASGPAFPNDLVRTALIVIGGASPPLTPSKRSSERYAAPVIADAIKVHRAGQASEADGKAVLNHLITAGLVAVTDVKVSRGGSRADTRKGLILTAAGKVALQQPTQANSSNPTPQSPQHPASTMQDDAGGTSPASPQRKWGSGGNAGVHTDEGQAPQEE